MTLPLLLALLESLVAPLGHDSFAVREAAQRRLEAALLQPNGHVLVNLLEARRDADPEVRRRCEVAAESFFRIRPTNSEKLPWIDSDPNAAPSTRLSRRAVRYRHPSDLPIHMEAEKVSDKDYFLAEARYQVGYLPHWGEYRYATHLYVRERLRAGDSREELVAEISRMMAWEIEWKRKNNYQED